VQPPEAFIPVQTPNDNILSLLVQNTVAGEAIQLELACEPSNIMQAALQLQQLAPLPPALMPAGGLEGWMQGDGCSLLQLGEKGRVKVRWLGLLRKL
jgi:hypothetical protein